MSILFLLFLLLNEQKEKGDANCSETGIFSRKRRNGSRIGFPLAEYRNLLYNFLVISYY